MGGVSAMMPSNHRLAERRLIAMVRDGVWSIDGQGRIWKRTTRSGREIGPVLADKLLPSGYRMIRAMLGGRRVCGLSHRLVWQHARGDIAEGMVINHLNGLKDDNRIENLEVVSYRENTLHAYRVGLVDEHGERNPAATLSDHDIGAIRAAYAAGDVTMAALGDRFGCSLQHVSKLIRGERRPKQAGPTGPTDHRHIASERDQKTGRFIPSEPPELNVREFPAAR